MNKIAFLSLSMAFLIFALPLPRNYNYFILGLFFVLDILLVSKKRVTVNWNYLLWMFSFLFICFISLFWSISEKYSFYIIHSNLLPLYSVMSFLFIYSRSLSKLRIVLSAFYVSAVIFLVYVFSIVDIEMLNEERIGMAIADEDIAEKLNSNYIAGRFVVAVYVGYYLFFKLQRKNIVMRSLFIGITLMMIYVVIISGSRTSLGILILPILVYYTKSSKNVVKIASIIVILIIIVYFVIMKIPQFYDIIGKRVEDAINVASGNQTGDEDTSRIVLVELGLSWFIENPIIGYGINCFRVLSDNTFKFGGRLIYAHNNYVELLVDIGLVGFIIYYAAHIIIIKSYMLIRKQNIGTVLLSLIVVLFFSDFFWVGYFNEISQFILCMAFVLVDLGRIHQFELVKTNIKYDKSRHYPAWKH